MIWVRVGTGIRVFEEVTVYITQVNELYIRRDGAKVKRGDLDGADEGGSLGRRELAVEDVDEDSRQ
jgi:hypothetical protein